MYVYIISNSIFISGYFVDYFEHNHVRLLASLFRLDFLGHLGRCLLCVVRYSRIGSKFKLC